MDDDMPTRAEVEARRPYPWILKASLGTVMSHVLPVLAVAGLLGFHVWSGDLRPDPSWLRWPAAAVVAGIGLLAAVALLQIASVLRHKVVLTADEIRRRDLFGWRSMKRDRICCISARRWVASGAYRLVLAPRPGQGRGLSLAVHDESDELNAWLEGLPSTDAARLHDFIARAQETWWLGRPAEARPGRLLVLDFWGRRLVWVLLILGFLLLFLRKEAHSLGLTRQALDIGMAVIAAVPLLAMATAAGARGLFRLAPTGRPDLRPLLGGFIVMPALMLAGRAADWARLVHPWQAVAAGLAVGSLLWLLACLIDRRGLSNPLVALAAWLVFAAYGYGVAVLADVELDHARPMGSVGRVLIKSPRDPRHIWVGFQADRPVVRSIPISRRDYARVENGEPACVLVYPGGLGLAWFRVFRCPDSVVSRLRPAPGAVEARRPAEPPAHNMMPQPRT